MHWRRWLLIRKHLYRGLIPPDRKVPLKYKRSCRCCRRSETAVSIYDGRDGDPASSARFEIEVGEGIFLLRRGQGEISLLELWSKRQTNSFAVADFSLDSFLASGESAVWISLVDFTLSSIPASPFSASPSSVLALGNRDLCKCDCPLNGIQLARFL